MDGLRRLLVEALNRLASPPAEQEAYLREFGTWPMSDELALDLDAVAEAPIRDLPVEARRQIRALSALLKSMSGPSPLWNGPSLYTAPEWAEVRELARRALAAMDASPAPARP
jgi:hypothetical protein